MKNPDIHVVLQLSSASLKLILGTRSATKELNTKKYNKYEVSLTPKELLYAILYKNFYYN